MHLPGVFHPDNSDRPLVALPARLRTAVPSCTPARARLLRAGPAIPAVHQSASSRMIDMRLNRLLGLSWDAVARSPHRLSETQPRPLRPIASPTSQQLQETPTYLVSFADNAPADLAARIEQAGGKVKKLRREAGVASVTSDAPDFEQKVNAIAGVEGVGKDRLIQWVDPNMKVLQAGDVAGSGAAGAHSIGDNETFFGIQWAPKSDSRARGLGRRRAGHRRARRGARWRTERGPRGPGRRGGRRLLGLDGRRVQLRPGRGRLLPRHPRGGHRRRPR